MSNYKKFMWRSCYKELLKIAGYTFFPVCVFLFYHLQGGEGSNSKLKQDFYEMQHKLRIEEAKRERQSQLMYEEIRKNYASPDLEK